MLNVNGLNAELAKNGMTQKELAEKLGITPQALSNKKKSGKIGIDEAKKIIDVLNIKDPLSIFFA